MTIHLSDDNLLPQAGDVSFAYDDNGNRFLKSDAHGETQYTYDFDNRLTAVVDFNQEAVHYHYDAMGRRSARVTGTKGKDISTYLYDGLDVLQEITGQNAQKITAYYRANGALVAQQEYNLSQGGGDVYKARPEGRLRYYAHDGLGSVVALTSYDGEIRAEYRYDAYGNTIVGKLNDNPYGFTGKRFDGESGLYHFHFRQYDPMTGVWTAEDPIGIFGGINLYGYVRNNPVNKYDLMGLIDVFAYVEGDLVGALGGEGGFGLVVDLNNIGDSGIFGTAGVAAGANAGYAVGGGFAIRELEGTSINVDINAGAVSPTVSFDEDGFNGVALAGGPGYGGSVSLTKTETYSINDLIDDAKKIVKSIKEKLGWEEPDQQASKP